MPRSLIILAIALAVSSCNDCQDCVEFTAEPVMNLQFLNEVDDGAKTVIIDSVNFMSTSVSRHLDDTSSVFKLPLNMNADESEFYLVFRDATNDSLTYSGTLNISYERMYERRNDNFVIVNCLVNSVTGNFDNLSLYCADSVEQTCLSYDLTATIRL